MSKVKVILESLAVGVIIFVLTIFNLFSSLDYLLKDAVYQVPRGINPNIKIIAIDEKTLDVYGPIGTWSREIYADLLKVLNQDETMRPEVVGFDIIFAGHVDEGDYAFAEEAQKSGNVVVVSQFVYEERPQYDENGLLYNPIASMVEPFGELKEVTTMGFSNVAQDSDGKVRRIRPLENFEGHSYNSFAQEIYNVYCNNRGTEMVIPEVDKYGKMMINYSGEPGDYEAISLVDVLEGKIDSRAFAGSIVLVGAYAPGMQDNFKVPNGNSEQMYGVEVHANILQAYMEQRFAINGNAYLAGAILGVIGACLHFAFRRLKIWQTTILLLVAIGGEIAGGVILNNRGTYISLLYFPVVMILSYVYCLASGYLLEMIKRKKTLHAFKKYVAPEIVEEISKKGDFSVKLGGENRDIAVLFVDIRGFTTMSEVLEPEQVVEILNQYLNLTTQSIFKNKGTLDKFVGDATMAVFNSPFDLEDYEYHAVCAALDIVEGGKELEKKLMEQFGRSVGFGVGVNCGPAVVGNIGCEFRMDFTAIGDTVNTAARLEANAKKGQVLISDALYERVKDRITVEEVGNIPLKGKSNGVFVYSVTGLKSNTAIANSERA